MIRDIRFAMCNTRPIKKSQTFRSLDLNNSLKLIPIRESVYNQNFQDLAKHEKKILKSKSAYGDYHAVPSESPACEIEMLTKTSTANLIKKNSLEIYDNVHLNANAQYHRHYRHHRNQNNRHSSYNEQDYFKDNCINTHLSQRHVNISNEPEEPDESQEFYA